MLISVLRQKSHRVAQTKPLKLFKQFTSNWPSHWQPGVTSICAIVGGTFTTVGLIDAVAHKVLKAGKQL